MPYLRWVFLAILSFAAGWIFVRHPISAAICTDSLRRQYDIATLAHKARVPAAFPLVNMSTCSDHPVAIQAIRDKIEAPLEQ